MIVIRSCVFQAFFYFLNYGLCLVKTHTHIYRILKTLFVVFFLQNRYKYWYEAMMCIAKQTFSDTSQRLLVFSIRSASQKIPILNFYLNFQRFEDDRNIFLETFPILKRYVFSPRTWCNWCPSNRQHNLIFGLYDSMMPTELHVFVL